MSDFNVGDTVIVNAGAHWYRHKFTFYKVTVKKITPKQVQVGEHSTRYDKEVVYPFTEERWRKLRDLMDTNAEMLSRHESERRWLSEAVKEALA
jgi:hypothetical protein